MVDEAPLLLDTHTWLWYAFGQKDLGSNARKTIDDARETSHLYASIASCWEIGQLAAKKKITLDLPIRPWMRQSIKNVRLQVIDLKRQQVMKAIDMIGNIGTNDPFDAFILATAIQKQATLISSDRHMRTYAKKSGLLSVLDARK